MDQTINKNQGIAVSILDKEFMIACPKNSEEALSAAADYLDIQMRKIRQSGRVIGTERIAVMAALNISNELLTLKNGPKTEIADDLKERLRFLTQKIDDALLANHLDYIQNHKLECEKEPEYLT